MEKQVRVDALPYYDTLINDKKVKAKVDALVEAEMAGYRPVKSYLADVLPPMKSESFLTPICEGRESF